ncbi:hypothetical protein BTIS_1691 [Bifidobacterium tissieri]|uniref:Uncharacterized protein n=1 Tax=Bifidobacterium tissieri TaxID=1630162 RepID=A0A261FD02_9BIFI|nr:hypothetical protein [Bifidobacterium tissieri]OZG57029.1 hypothetical protein BTIS_1691 [Bifidobacterium tissieri]
MLEACYEQFDDQDVVYYLVVESQVETSESYRCLKRLKKISGDDWRSQCELMVRLLLKYYPELLSSKEGELETCVVSALREECQKLDIQLPRIKADANADDPVQKAFLLDHLRDGL